MRRRAAASREGPATWHTAPALTQKHFRWLEGCRWVPWVLCLSHRACQRWPGQEARGTPPPGEGGQEALSLCRPGLSGSQVRRQGLVLVRSKAHTY